MLSKAADLEYAITSSEKEALLLEASLIKKHRPRYNVVLRDDKNYLSIRIDPRDPYPRLDIVRRFQKDGALYFGPYTSARAARDTLKYLHQLFPLRLCKGKKLIPRERPCLNHSMGQCLGACAGKVSTGRLHEDGRGSGAFPARKDRHPPEAAQAKDAGGSRKHCNSNWPLSTATGSETLPRRSKSSTWYPTVSWTRT